MAVTATTLDGNNVGFVFDAAGSVNALSIDLGTGAAASAYIPQSWLQPLKDNARKLFDVTSLGQRTVYATSFLERLVAVGSIGGATVTVGSSVVGTVATLTIAVDASDTILLNLPHSIMGGLTAGQSVPASGGGGGGTVTFADLGEVNAPGGPYLLIPFGAAVYADGGNIQLADQTLVNTLPCIGLYTGASTNRIRNSGLMTGFSGLTPDADYYVGVGGAITTVEPTTVGVAAQYIGHSLNATDLFVDLDMVKVNF